jgi:hypothetical protein
MRRHSATCTPCCSLQYYRNFKGFKDQIDGFRGRLQTLLTSLPVCCRLTTAALVLLFLSC